MHRNPLKRTRRKLARGVGLEVTPKPQVRESGLSKDVLLSVGHQIRELVGVDWQPVRSRIVSLQRLWDRGVDFPCLICGNDLELKRFADWEFRNPRSTNPLGSHTVRTVSHRDDPCHSCQSGNFVEIALCHCRSWQRESVSALSRTLVLVAREVKLSPSSECLDCRSNVHVRDERLDLFSKVIIVLKLVRLFLVRVFCLEIIHHIFNSHIQLGVEVAQKRFLLLLDRELLPLCRRPRFDLLFNSRGQKLVVRVREGGNLPQIRERQVERRLIASHSRSDSKAIKLSKTPRVPKAVEPLEVDVFEFVELDRVCHPSTVRL